MLALPKSILWLAMLFLFAGWDFSKHSVPVEDIVSGGPPKDGIPAIDKPRFVFAHQNEADFMEDSDRVLGITVHGKTKAYPIKILNWHEIVNDRLGGKDVVITFCPLCGTGMVFSREVNGRAMTFGVSGLLYQSDVLLYDRQTESLWSQIKQEAVAGSLTATRLNLLPSTHTTWSHWKEKHPDTLVLSTDTGYNRDYSRDPYEAYYESRQLMFGVSKVSARYHPKEQVIGIVIDGQAKAWPFSELEKARLPVKDEVGGQTIRVRFDAETNTAVIENTTGRELPSVVGFWFAWYAFHPKTEVFTVKP
ncbi:conserved hypothetical protein [Nitrospina gracilis 3/211]|uniref:DUF3179 domain-containing protein n=1 Tax=Nitrospina gracilis (strain 3/211) TaxID=1266370 RepID=M1YWE0_NITG3|nr:MULTISPECIES: DUF3179 domain-containing protein [Nitrospina]MCF8722359.1 hypothetical protein [Nitrospina sp. Nb-3]CCQ89971.1 conserved hypothetical protein [Nitrospina gracilis 3/211]